MTEEDKEVQKLVKRLARFLGLEAVEKRVLGFKRHVALRDQHSERNAVKIRGCQANFLSWKDALCKFLGAECFKVYQELEDDEVLTKILLIDNPFFGLSFEEASLRLDLLEPEKKKEEEEEKEDGRRRRKLA